MRTAIKHIDSIFFKQATELMVVICSLLSTIFIYTYEFNNSHVNKNPSGQVKRLIMLLKSSNSEMRREAAVRLEMLNEDTMTAIPVLIEALQDSDEDVLIQVIYTLSRFGSKSEQVIYTLAEMLSNGSPRVRSAAAHALAMNKIYKYKKVVTQLIKALKDDNAEVRFYSLRALRTIPRKEKTVIEAIFTTLGDEDNIIRKEAQEVLSEMGKEALPYLVKGLRHSNQNIVTQSAYALGRMGTVALNTKDIFLQLLPKAKLHTKISFLYALAKLSNNPKDYINKIKDLLIIHQNDVNIRKEALQVFVEFPKEAKDSVGMILSIMVSNRDVWDCIEGNLVLNSIAKEYPEEIIKYSKHDNDDFRRIAFEILTQVENPPQQVVVAITNGLKDQHSGVRRTSINYLKKHTDTNSLILNGLIHALKDNDSYVRKTAAEILGTLKINNLLISEELQYLLNDEIHAVRKAAKKALKQIRSLEDKNIRNSSH